MSGLRAIENCSDHLHTNILDDSTDHVVPYLAESNIFTDQEVFKKLDCLALFYRCVQSFLCKDK